MEILTVVEVAAMLKVSKRHVYELTKNRTQPGDIREHPLPVLRLGASVRFRKSDVEAWVEKLWNVESKRVDCVINFRSTRDRGWEELDECNGPAYNN